MRSEFVIQQMHFPDIESLVRLKSNHQSLLEEPVDVQQHSHNFRYDHITMNVSTPSLIEEIPELSGHVSGGFTSASSQIPSGQFHCDSDVLMAPLLVEDSPLIESYGSVPNQGSGHRSRGSPTKETRGLLECHGLIGMPGEPNSMWTLRYKVTENDLDPEAKAQDALWSPRLAKPQAVLSAFVAVTMRLVAISTAPFISRASTSNPFWPGGCTLDIACTFLKGLLGGVGDIRFIMPAHSFSQAWTRLRTRRPLPLCTEFLLIMSSTMSRTPYCRLYFLHFRSTQSFLALCWPSPICTTSFPSIMISAMSRSSYWHFYFLLLQSLQSFLALFCKFGSWTWKWHFLWVSFLGAVTYYHLESWDDAIFHDLHGRMPPRHIRRRFQPT